ncbi:hypothetical protein CCR75_002811 [Bremia lactucae]|uniref:Uncharacterized protein n=1 Tax=Bremia lactucae TaxID=4779 RepID=A0A976IGW6_BRELC|nr:hypothetical protein CCR75_002811 [Bremia lactucae]
MSARLVRMLEVALIRGKGAKVNAFIPRPAPFRALSNAAHATASKTDGFYVSKKAVKTTLLVGAALSAGLYYMKAQENADWKKLKLLLGRSQMSLEKGDIEQFKKVQEKAYGFLKKKFPDDKSVIALAMAIGASHERTDHFSQAIPFYQEALENIALEKRFIHREDLRIVMLDRLGQCYKKVGDLEAAEKHFHQAIEVYDQVKASISLTPGFENEGRIILKLDEDILNVFLHYVILLTVLQRNDDIERARLRLSTIARNSVQLRGEVAKINCQVDDYIALEKIREERKIRKTKSDEGV